MGFKQREKKRRRKAAAEAARARLRASSSRSSSSRWWLTLVSADCCCARCAGMLRVGREMVYRATPREALCVTCADRDPAVSYRPSVSWERARRTRP